MKITQILYILPVTCAVLLHAQDGTWSAGLRLTAPKGDLGQFVDQNLGLGLVGSYSRPITVNGDLRIDLAFDRWSTSTSGSFDRPLGRGTNGSLSVGYQGYLSQKRGSNFYFVAAVSANRWNLKPNISNPSYKVGTTKIGGYGALGYKFSGGTSIECGEITSQIDQQFKATVLVVSVTHAF